MPNCTSDELEFGRLGRQVFCTDFDGGDISTESGVMLLRQVDSKISLTKAVCAPMSMAGLVDVIGGYEHKKTRRGALGSEAWRVLL